MGKSSYFKKPSKTTEVKQRSHVTFKVRTKPGFKSKIPSKTESIMFIPFTPNSDLKRKLQEAESFVNGKKKTCRVRMIERSGPTIASLLYNKQPWKQEPCGRVSCMPCETKPGSCRKSNVTYRVKCNDCHKSGTTTTYIGETHRSLFDRSKEHQAALRRKNGNYAIVKHWDKSHPEITSPPEFSYQVIKSHKSAFERQIWEAVLIQIEKNGKGELGMNLVPQLKPHS